MSTSSLNVGVLSPARDTRALLVKWLVALLVPIAVFTFVWSGEAIINNALLGIFGSANRRPLTWELLSRRPFLLCSFMHGDRVWLVIWLRLIVGGGAYLELWLNVLDFCAGATVVHHRRSVI